MCDKPAADRSGEAYPFCSKRCKMADLGRWLGGEYRIPVRQVEEEEDEAPGTKGEIPS
jgi:uncharacterized protein